MTPGTYTSSKQGQVGPVEVSVTVDKNKITDIKITSQKETVGIGAVAAPKMAAKVLNSQSLAVDGIAGATVTSNAVLQAIKEGLVKAGADIKSFEQKSDKQLALVPETMKTDLVIIGGGGAGMIAAINATQQGLKVILLEKMDFLGGASGICAGGMLIEGSKLQKELGVTNDSPESFVSDMKKNGQNLNNEKTLETYARNVGPTVDWLLGQGVQLITEGGIQSRAEFSVPRLLFLKGGCPGYAEFLRSKVRDSGATILLGTKAEDIAVKDGKVVGVEAVGNGKKYTIDAQAVLLATGGYGANRDMLQGDLKNKLYYGPVSSTGDGQRTAEKLNAKMQLMPYAKIYYNGVEVAPGKAKSTLTGNATALSIGAIMVDKNGQRVVDEKGTGRSIVTAQAKAPQGMLYLVMDKPTFDKFRTGIKNNGISEAEVDQWLEKNGTGTPLFAHGKTLEEAAQRAQIDPANLKATVARFNEFVQAGKDSDFGRKPANLKAKISSEGPYFIVEQKPRFATTMGSVTLNDSMQVIDKNGNPIPNLYAAGEVANSVHGDDSAPAANVSWVATSAKLASDSIVKQLKK